MGVYDFTVKTSQGKEKSLEIQRAGAGNFRVPLQPVRGTGSGRKRSD